MCRRSLAVVFALLALTGCPDSKVTAPPVAVPPGASPPSTSPPVTNAPPAKETEPALPLDPMYDPLKVGEVYVVKMDYGTPLTSRAEIKAKDAETVTIVTRSELGSEKTTSENTCPRRKLPLDMKLAAAPSEEKVLREETLTISGIEFACKVTESSDALGKHTSWKCEKHYPGLVKQLDDSGKTVWELVEVQAPKGP